MELLIPLGPTGLFRLGKEIGYPPITLQKAALYAERCTVSPVVGALASNTPNQLVPWGEAYARCMNGIWKAMDTPLVLTSCFCTNEGDCHKDLANTTAIPLQVNQVTPSCLNAAFHQTFSSERLILF